MSKTRLNELTFHAIVESTSNAILLVNKEGKIAYVNRQAETLFGYSSPEFVGQAIEILIPKRFRSNHANLRRAFSEAPTLRAMGVGRELYALRKDGSEFPVEIGLNPIVMVDDTWILASVVDISDRKKAEERFQRVVHSAPMAMILIERSGEISLVNERATTLFGYTEKELVCQKMEILLPERYRGGHPMLRDSFFLDPKTRSMGAGRDLVARRKDGTEVPVEVGLNPLEIDGKLMVLVTILDITERKARDEMRAKKEAAEAAYRAKGELLAIATHDLKNPLASIAGLAELMLEMKKSEVETPHQDIEFLQTIYDASRHMSEVVKGILANEGLEQQGIVLSEERIDLSALCKEIVDFNRRAAEKKSITLVEDLEPDIAVRGDRTRLREAFDNYVSNAVKYSPPGKRVTVSLNAIASGAQIEFGVRDEGPGLTEDDKSKLFGKFKKLSARPTGGESSTGLGLSIVKTIIELHKGMVGCESTLGQGAYFWARLPK